VLDAELLEKLLELMAEGASILRKHHNFVVFDVIFDDLGEVLRIALDSSFRLDHINIWLLAIYIGSCLPYQLLVSWPRWL